MISVRGHGRGEAVRCANLGPREDRSFGLVVMHVHLVKLLGLTIQLGSAVAFWYEISMCPGSRPP